jgi:hypothetical protein
MSVKYGTKMMPYLFTLSNNSAIMITFDIGGLIYGGSLQVINTDG